jgi:hypothetical protein
MEITPLLAYWSAMVSGIIQNSKTIEQEAQISINNFAVLCLT